MFRCAVHQNEFTTFGNENRIFFSHFLKEGSCCYINSEVAGREGKAVGLRRACL